jgi:HK97 family phage major capsid protein
MTSSAALPATQEPSVTEETKATDNADVVAAIREIPAEIAKAVEAQLAAALKKREQPDKEGKPRVFQKGYLPWSIDRDSTDVGLHLNRFPRGDAENFSVSRAAFSLLMMKRGTSPQRAWSHAPWEKQYLEALAQLTFKGGAEGVIQKAQGDQVSGIDGGFLAPEIWSQKYFQILTSISAIDRLPVARFNVPARVIHIPKTALDVTVSYPGENTAPTATQYSFGQMTYTARKASVVINASIEMMRDAPLYNDQLLREEGARSIAVDRDKQAFTGNPAGSFTPTGLVNAAQVGTFTLAADSGNGGTPAYADFTGIKYQTEHLSANTNVTSGQTIVDGIVANIRLNKSIQNILDTSNRPIWPQHLEAAGGFIGIPNWKLVADSVIPINLVKGSGTTCSYIIAGAWRNFVLFDCLALGFDITEEAQGMQNAQAQIRLIHRWDAGPSHPEAFTVASGVLV